MNPLALIVSLIIATLLAPAAAAQQAARIHRIGILSFFPLPSSQVEALREGLRALKYVEGRDLVIVIRSANRDRKILPRLAAELVAEKPDVLVATTGTSTLALKRVTKSIPIVMLCSSDAVGMGIVSSLARPGGNVTGFTIISPDLAPKRLELLTALPGVRRVAILWCPEGAPINREELRRTADAATRLGVNLVPVEYRRGTSWQSFSTALSEARAQAIFQSDCTSLPFRSIFKWAIQNRLPLITPYFVLGSRRGVLLAYGANGADTSRRAAGHVDRILKGARPADLPVEQPTELRLVINMKTAKAIGLTIPRSLLLRADKVIE